MFFNRLSKTATASNKTAARRGAPAHIESLENRALLSAVTFTLNPALSSVTVSSPTIPLTPQAKGGLTTTYKGTFTASETATSLQFLGGGALIANTNGKWNPGNALGDYGAIADKIIDGAVRNLSFILSSGKLTIGAGGKITGTTEKLTSKTGTLELKETTGTAAPITLSLAKVSGLNTATGGTITIAKGVATISLPIKSTVAVTVDGSKVYFTFAGKIVATAKV